MTHINSALCPKCDEIINKYPGINPTLISWFRVMRAKYNMLHVSEAGRGKERQNQLFMERTPDGERKTKAVWGHSAHNYNCACDVFVNLKGLPIYDEHWFRTYFQPEVPEYLNWYGMKGSSFIEFPHIEVRNWKDLREKGEVKLVEDSPVKVKLT